MEQPPTGRRRTYCSDACKVAASRRRSTAEPDLQPATLAPYVTDDGVMVVPLSPGDLAPGRTAAAMASLLADRPPATTDEQVAVALTEAHALVVSLRRLGHDARPEFAWRCAGVADALHRSLSEFFPI